VKLSERIKRWRETREPEITKAELARRVGVSSAAVAQWEGGTTEPTHDNVEAIAHALDLTLSGFWGDPPPLKREAKAS
jgi:transcriptional regulator with XRE-family HTH domain